MLSKLNQTYIIIVLLVLITTLFVYDDIFKKDSRSVKDTISSSQSSLKEDRIFFEKQLAPDFPEFPVYPKATLEESSQRVTPLGTGNDLYAEWYTTDSVGTVMKWYLKVLQIEGWMVEFPETPESSGEQIAKIYKGKFSGDLVVENELEENKVEIVVDLVVSVEK